MGLRGDENFDFDDFEFDDDNDLRGDVGGTDDFTDFESGFDDFDSDVEMGEDFDVDLGEEIGDDFNFEEIDEESSGGGTSRTFIILAAVMILLFVVGLIAVVFLATRPTGPTDVELTITARVAFNSTQEAFATATQEANQVLFMTQTQEAAEVMVTQTALASMAFANFLTTADVRTGPDEIFDITGSIASGEQADILAVNPTGAWYLVQASDGTQGWVPLAAISIIGNTAVIPQDAGPATPTQEVAIAPTVDPTQLAAEAAMTAAAQATALAGTGTPEILEPSPTGGGISSVQEVQQTATALFLAFQSSPTAEVGTPVGGGVVRPTALPDTGLLDDVVAGGAQGLGAFFLAAIGLIGVIFVSRRLRAVNQ